MATIIKRKGKWQVKIRRTNFKQLSKTFITKDNAIKWARETESKVEKGLFEDLSQTNSISLKEIPQKYPPLTPKLCTLDKKILSLMFAFLTLT